MAGLPLYYRAEERISFFVIQGVTVAMLRQRLQRMREPFLQSDNRDTLTTRFNTHKAAHNSAIDAGGACPLCVARGGGGGGGGCCARRQCCDGGCRRRRSPRRRVGSRAAHI